MTLERHRSGLLTAGGVLTLIAGALGLAEGIRAVVLSATGPWEAMEWVGWVHIGHATEWMLAGGIISIALAAIAIAGGIHALRVSSWGWALAGAICGLVATFIPGLLGLIFIAASRKDFT
jgi:hypothetical protein